MSTSILLNLALAIPIFTAIVGLLSWAVLTQVRGDGPTTRGPGHQSGRPQPIPA